MTGWTSISDGNAPIGNWIVAYRDHGELMFAVGFYDDDINGWCLTDWGHEIPNPEAIHSLPDREDLS